MQESYNSTHESENDLSVFTSSVHSSLIQKIACLKLLISIPLFLKSRQMWDDADGWASWSCCVEQSAEMSLIHAMKWAASWRPWASLP